MEELSFEEVWQAISSRGMYQRLPGVTIMKGLLSSHGNIHKGFKIIHVAGTNGKGSTASYISGMLRANGHKMGLYTSPHLISPVERICVDGEPIPKADFIRLARPLLAEDEVTVSDILLLLALYWFKEQECEYLVIETGLGGLMDSTNALTGDGEGSAAQVCVITRIGLDHTAILGESLSGIALQKAGIIKQGGRVVLAEMPDEALEVLEAYCRDKGISYIKACDNSSVDDWIKIHYPDIYLTYQRENLKNAVLTMQLLGEDVPFVEQLKAPNGRLHIRRLSSLLPDADIKVSGDRMREPVVIFDGAHNPQGAAALFDSIKAIYPTEKFDCLIGIVSDKDAIGIIEPFLSIMKSAVITCAGHGSRASDGRLWGSRIEAAGIPVTYIPSPAEAYDRLIHTDVYSSKLIFGSLYLIGDVIRL